MWFTAEIVQIGCSTRAEGHRYPITAKNQDEFWLSVARTCSNAKGLKPGGGKCNRYSTIVLSDSSSPISLEDRRL